MENIDHMDREKGAREGGIRTRARDLESRGDRGVGGGVRGKQERSVRRWIIFFIIALALSGLTAFALETELGWLVGGWPFARGGSLYGWVLRVYAALRDINLRYPFLAYGYDWLAFIAGTVRGIPI